MSNKANGTLSYNRNDNVPFALFCDDDGMKKCESKKWKAICFGKRWRVI